jgi:glycosyltransferase involved in cell wall biosynthesis
MAVEMLDAERVGHGAGSINRPLGIGARAGKPHVCLMAPMAWPVFSGDLKTEIVGGAEVQLSILARALVGAGYPVSMICLDFGQPEVAQVDGVTVHKTYGLDTGLPLIRFLHPRITSMWRVMRTVNADIYYQRCSGMLTGVVAAFSNRYGKRSIFAGASDLDFMPGRQQIRYRRDRRMFEWGLRRVDAVVVQNSMQLLSCRIHYGLDSTLIPNAYEPPPAARPGGGDAVLWVANVRPYKRPEVLLELARRLPHRRFVLVGGAGGHDTAPGGYFEAVRREAQALPNVEFTGFLPLARVEAYFDRARVVVNTSLNEGMPNTFLQAWSRGVPTVAFVDPGTQLDGEPVHLQAATVGEMATGIERLFADPLLHARVSKRCRQYFERTHSVAQVVTHYEVLLDRLAATAGTHP